MTKTRGFTLIEILVVIVILGILSAIAVPRLAGFQERTKTAEVMKYYDEVRRAAMICFNAHGSWEECHSNENGHPPSYAKFENTMPQLSAHLYDCLRAAAGCTTALGYCEYRVTLDAPPWWWSAMRIYSDGRVGFNGSGAFLAVIPAGSLDAGIVSDPGCIP